MKQTAIELLQEINSNQKMISDRITKIENMISTDLINQKEAAKVLNISIPTLRKMVQKGQIKFYQLGDRAMFRRQDMYNFLNSI